MANLEYKVIVGLEIHVQLRTTSKLFCGCAVEFAASPNSRVCPVCLGMPGVLPVMNKLAFEQAVLAAMALNCKIARFTKWDRKSYYYPDLPKNYQISQYDLPFSENGFIEIPAGPGLTTTIKIIRAHLEEDAGKNLHSAGNFSQVDLNRTGTALLEIVTAPDMNSGAEVRILAVELQRIVRYLGVSEADMQKGHMRFEPNVNLIITKDGKDYKTPIVEIKNLNSFRALERSVDYEVRRQLDEFDQTGVTMEIGNKTTRGWDAERQVTVLQRAKEESDDYRYFPDPDLVPVELDDRWLADIGAKLCELPVKKQIRFVNEYKLSDYDAGVLTAQRETAEFFDQIVTGGAEPKRVCNLLCQTGLKLANEAQCSLVELGLDAGDVAGLAKMIDDAKIGAGAGATILEQMVKTGKKPQTIAEELNLLQKNDSDQLEAIVDQVIAENPQAVADATGGGKKSKKAHGFLMGKIIRKTEGRANPKIVSLLLDRKLN